VVDIGGHIAQCHLELSDGNPVESVESAVEVVTTPEETTQDETTPVVTTQDETTPAVTPVIVSIFVILFTFNERT
jgi:hypothetical protein